MCKPENLLCWGVEKGDNERTYTCKNIETTPACLLLAAQEKLLHKVVQAKEARVSLNTMRRMHLERIRQQEQEQSILARMQMEQKLALLRQQKAEQTAYQEALRQERMVKLSTQQQEFEQQIQEQREKERLQLIAQEQQVLQSHFGGGRPLPPPQDDHVSAYGGGPQTSMMPSGGGQYHIPSAMTLQEVQQLPTKVEPDLYHPPPYTASEPLYQPLLQHQPQPQSLYHHHPLPLQSSMMPLGLSMAPTHSMQGPVPPQLATYHNLSSIQPPPAMYSPSPSQQQQPSGLPMQSLPYAVYNQPPPISVQRQESEPPLIVL